MNGPHWIKQWIADLALLNDQFRNEDGSVDFSALGREEYQFRMALITRKFSNSERAKDIFEKAKAAYEVNVERGKKGGRPRKNPEETQVAEATALSAGGSCATNEARESQRRAGADSVRGTPLHSAPARSRAKNSRCPNSREEFHAFVADNNLHEGLAEEWYAMHEARGWVDKNGNPIKDWRGALYNYCTKTEQKRRTA